MPTLNNATLTLGASLTVTNNVVTGTGVFDDLMEAVTTHLEAQYQLGRITGGDFATVYLGAMQSALQQSVGYAVGAEKTNADVILTGKQGLLVDAQELKTDAEKLLVDAQELQVDGQTALGVKQGTLTDNQAASELKKALDIVNTTTNRSAAQATSETTAVQQRLLIVNQIATELKQALDLVGATSLKDKQALTQVKQALDLVSTTTVRNAQSAADVTLKGKQGTKVDADKLLVDANELLVDAQKLKVDGEKALILQKQTTEYGQTLVTGNTTPNANSILGKQATLYGEQAKGFKWNADQKYLKTLLDAWAINISTAGVASTQVTALNATGTGNINTQITNAEPTG